MKFLIIFILCLFFASVYAQNKAPKGASSKVDHLKKSSVQVPTAEPTYQKREALNLNDIKPPKSSDIYAATENYDQREYEKTLDKQIAELYKITQSFKKSENRGELWIRLAELYVEKANLVGDRIQSEYEVKLKKFKSGQTTEKPPLPNLEAAHSYNRKALRLYEGFLKEFPQDEKVDQALFFLAYDNFELGDTSEGLRYYKQLVNQFPNSRFAPDAHFAIAEYYFDAEKWPEAQAEYEYVIKANGHTMFTMAMYKAAWCLYRQGKAEAGISYLHQIIKSGKANREAEFKTSKKVNKERLENEAYKDLIIFYADTGKSNEAIEYFGGLKSKEGDDSLEKLATYQSSKGHIDAAREVYRYLIAKHPKSVKNFDFSHHIVQDYFFSKKSVEFKKELFLWVAEYGNNSDWFKANANDQIAINHAVEMREKALRSYILQTHQDAQNSKTNELFEDAKRGYNLYFEHFSKNSFAADMRFYYGELLYDLGNYNESAQQYSFVISQFPQSKFIEQASRNKVLCFEKLLPTDETLHKQVGTSTVAQKLNISSENFVVAVSEHLLRYPADEKAAELKFKVGRLHYMTNNFLPAEEQFKDVVKNHPKTTFSEYSANLLLDIYTLKNDYSGLEKVGSELMNEPGIKGSKLALDISGVMEKANFKNIQSLEGAKNYSLAAEKYIGFVAAHPKSELAITALLNAGINYEKNGNNTEALLSYKKVIDFESNNIEAKNSAKKYMASIYVQVGQYAEAAELFEQLTNHEKVEPKTQANFALNSAIMYELVANIPKAIMMYDKYIKLPSESNSSQESLFKIAELYRKNRQNTEAIKTYSQFAHIQGANEAKKCAALYWKFTLNSKASKDFASETQSQLKQVTSAATGEKKVSCDGFLAKLKLQDVELQYSKYKLFMIPTNESKQKQALDKKLETLAGLSEKLSEILKLAGPEETVQSLFILGDSNQNMAESLRSTPLPQGLDEESKKLYIEEIEKVAGPFQQKADESFKLTVERGRSLKVYSDSFKKAYVHLATKYPGDYPDVKEKATVVNEADWMLK